MNLTYTPELQTYMQKKGYSHIVIELAEATGCCAGFTDIVGRFATEKQIEKLNKQVIRTLEAPLGTIIVTVPGLQYSEEITVELKSFIGLKDITFDGIKIWDT